MKYYLPLLLIVILTINSSAVFAAATSASAVGKTETEEREKEYAESKHFPKKGNYLKWIEANKQSNQGVRLARAGKYSRAIPYFQRAIQRYGFDYTYYENLGAALHKTGNLERAESTTEMAAHLAPRRWGPWFNLGLILTKQHEYKRALIVLKRAKALKPPPAKVAGINRLITALEFKLSGGSANTTASTSKSPSDGAASSSQQQTTTPNTDSTGADTVTTAPPEATAQEAQPTTVPDITAAPVSHPSESEKGN